MALLHPFHSKSTVSENVPQEIYSCPANKSHAVVDVNFLKLNNVEDAMIEIALTTKTDPATVNSVDYFIDDIQLIGNINGAELNKVIVGGGEKLYVNVVNGPDVNIRVTGVEESNPNVIKAGRLAATSVAGTGPTVIYENNAPNTSYSTVSITIYNASELETADIKAWITENATGELIDLVLDTKLLTNDTIIIENLTLLPNEKIIVQSSEPDSEWFVNGIIVGTA